MTRYLLTLGFALSVLFNIFFAIGFVQARADTGEASVAQRVADELELDVDQREFFRQLRGQVEQELEPYREQIALIDAELRTLYQGGADEELIHEARDRRHELRRESSEIAESRFREFHDSLDPEQRRELFDRMKHDRHQRFLDRFDTNKDGDIDEAENRAARDHFRRGGRGRGGRGGGGRNGGDRGRPPAALLRFDENGNGVLDDAEIEAIRAKFAETLEENRRRGMSDPPPTERHGDDGV